MRRAGEFMLVRILWALGLLSLAAWCGGCRCGSHSYDRVFLLNAAAGPALIDSDAGGPAAADAGPVLDCTPSAAGCVAGGPCSPACTCVLARDLEQNAAANITKCTLLADPDPAVEVHYTITFSGCGD